MTIKKLKNIFAYSFFYVVLSKLLIFANPHLDEYALITGIDTYLKLIPMRRIKQTSTTKYKISIIKNSKDDETYSFSLFRQLNEYLFKIINDLSPYVSYFILHL